MEHNTTNDGDTEYLFCGGNYKSDYYGKKCIRCFHWGDDECGGSAASFKCLKCSRKLI